MTWLKLRGHQVQNGPQFGTNLANMATASRLLTLLAMMSTRPHWSAFELAERLEITERTVRRDITRLREIGYPVEAAPGVHGGYRLGSGGKIPPLLLDDDEAVAMAIGLAAAAGAGSSGLEVAAVSALSKLDRVLPPRLRERVNALGNVTLGLRGTEVPAVDTDVLVVLALACQRPERIRFDYRDAQDQTSHRIAEPYRLVFTDRHWYLVANDTGRKAWRTFRVDRITDLVSTGIPFTHGDVPDAAAQVAAGVAVWGYDLRATVRLQATRADVERMIPPTVGVIDHDDTTSTTVRIGGEAPWIARYLAGLPCSFEVIDPPEVRDELRALGRRLVHDHKR
jgi:predicted DNA-binding transcriptional regulator YafY